MSSLLPDAVHDAIDGRSVFSASESFGLVALVLLIVLLLEREARRTARPARDRMIALSAVIVPLLVVVALTIAARIVELVT